MSLPEGPIENSASPVPGEWDELLGHLRRWRQMPESELQRSFDATAGAILARIVEILGDARAVSKPITADNFVATVHAMYDLLGSSARAYAEAAMEAMEHLEDGDKMEAVEAYRRFLNTCPSEYFRTTARKRLESIERQSIASLLSNPNW